MLVRRKSACKTSAGSSKILRWLTPLLGPNLDPKTGPKQRLKRRNENVIDSGPHFGVHIWTQKWGQPSETFAAARTCCASRFATLQLEHECQLIPFSLCASQVRLLLYSFESPWASLCPCANTFCVRGVASARLRRASKRLDCRLWKHGIFHQQNRKGLVLGSFLVPEIDMIFRDGVGASLVRGPYCQLGVG